MEPSKLGRYEIIKELGEGAMGVVYKAHDPEIDRVVALKTVRRELLEKSEQMEEVLARFHREAQAAGQLNHPGIVTIYDVGEEDGTAYIAMEFLEGTPLDELIDHRERFTVEKAVDLVAQICEALDFAHQKGIYHRDIKPANIVLMKDGRIKIADFGIARTEDSKLTQSGAIIGTPHYMSPEQFMSQRIDGRSDLFSAAVILYELLTGEKPFTGEALTTVMHNIVKSKPIPVRELNFQVPQSLSDAVDKCLAKDPNERYPRGTDMAAALRASLTGPMRPPAAGVDATILTPEARMAATHATGGMDKTVPIGPQAVAAPQAPPGGAPVVAPRPASAVPGIAKVIGAVVVLVAVGIAVWVLVGKAKQDSETVPPRPAAKATVASPAPVEAKWPETTAELAQLFRDRNTWKDLVDKLPDAEKALVEFQAHTTDNKSLDADIYLTEEEVPLGQKTGDSNLVTLPARRYITFIFKKQGYVDSKNNLLFTSGVNEPIDELMLTPDEVTSASSGQKEEKP